MRDRIESLFELIGTTDKQDYTSLLFNIYEDEDYGPANRKEAYRELWGE